MSKFSTAKTLEELKEEIKNKIIDTTELKNYINADYIWENKKIVKHMTHVFHINDYTHSKQGVFNLFVQIMNIYDKNYKFDVLPDIDLRDPEQEITVGQIADNINDSHVQSQVQSSIATFNSQSQWISEEYEKLTPEEKEKYSSQEINIEELIKDDIKEEEIDDDFINELAQEIEEEVMKEHQYKNIRKRYIDIILTERNLDRDYLIDEDTGRYLYYSLTSDARRQNYRSIAFKELEQDDEITDEQLDEIKEKIIADFSNKESIQLDIISQFTYDEQDYNTLENFIVLLSDFFDNEVTQDTELMKSIFEQINKRNEEMEELFNKYNYEKNKFYKYDFKVSQLVGISLKDLDLYLSKLYQINKRKTESSKYTIEENNEFYKKYINYPSFDTLLHLNYQRMNINEDEQREALGKNIGWQQEFNKIVEGIKNNLEEIKKENIPILNEQKLNTIRNKQYRRYIDYYERHEDMLRKQIKLHKLKKLRELKKTEDKSLCTAETHALCEDKKEKEPREARKENVDPLQAFFQSQRKSGLNLTTEQNALVDKLLRETFVSYVLKNKDLDRDFVYLFSTINYKNYKDIYNQAKKHLNNISKEDFRKLSFIHRVDNLLKTVYNLNQYEIDIFMKRLQQQEVTLNELKIKLKQIEESDLPAAFVIDVSKFYSLRPKYEEKYKQEHKKIAEKDVLSKRDKNMLRNFYVKLAVEDLNEQIGKLQKEVDTIKSWIEQSLDIFYQTIVKRDVEKSLEKVKVKLAEMNAKLRNYIDKIRERADLVLTDNDMLFIIKEQLYQNYKDKEDDVYDFVELKSH
jgi:hypothetical protein